MAGAEKPDRGGAGRDIAPEADPRHSGPGPTHGEARAMAEAKLIDGKAIAAELRADVARRAKALAPGVVPGLAAVLVGEDPASEVYVRNKGKQTREAGMNSFE